MEAPNTPKEVLDMISVAMVCRSNMNRSMEAHYRAYKRGYAVSSYGTGKLVRIPGANRIPKEYVFGTPYQSIYRSMVCCLIIELLANYVIDGREEGRYVLFEERNASND